MTKPAVSSPSRVTNQAGFVTTLMSTLPFVVTCALCVFASQWFIEHKQQAQWSCEKNVMKAQKALLAGVNELLALNTPIQIDVMERKSLRIMMRTAPDPGTRAFHALELAKVEMRLARRRMQQETIKTTRRLEAQSAAMTLNAETSLQARSIGTVFEISVNQKSKMRDVDIFLKKKTIDRAPPYIRSMRSSNAAIITRGSVFLGEDLFPQWLLAFKKPLYWQEKCGAKSVKEGGQWVAKLKLDKL